MVPFRVFKLVSADELADLLVFLALRVAEYVGLVYNQEVEQGEVEVAVASAFFRPLVQQGELVVSHHHDLLFFDKLVKLPHALIVIQLLLLRAFLIITKVPYFNSSHVLPVSPHLFLFFFPLMEHAERSCNQDWGIQSAEAEECECSGRFAHS